MTRRSDAAVFILAAATGAAAIWWRPARTIQQKETDHG